MVPSNPTLDQRVREGFAVLVRESFGLVFPPSRVHSLDYGIVKTAAALGEPDLAVLLDRVVGGDAVARTALITELTVGETYFFRDDHHFTFVRDLVLPALARRGGAIRLWSAGCATGEEAWSLAIAAHEALGGVAGARVEVIGTDLNPAFLERARRGWYGAWSFRGVDPARRDRFFRPERDGWVVAPAMRPAVRFASLNLLDGASAAWPRGVDVIFCRNVAIYFDLETVARVGARLALALREGGWLVPGPSDPLLPTGIGLTATMGGPLVYRRTANPVAVPPPHPVAPPPPLRSAGRRSSVPRIRRTVRSQSPSSASRPLAVPASPPCSDDQIARARALADAGDLAGATSLLNAAVVQDGLNPALYLLRSTVRQATGDDRGACEDADKAIVLDRSLAFAHVLAAAARTRLGDVTAARRALRNARALLLSSLDAALPHSDGHSRGALIALCNRLARTLGRAAPPRHRGG